MNEPEMNVPDSPDDLGLAELAPYIAKRHKDASAMADITRAAGNHAVLSAWLAGKALNMAKGQIEHGNWLKWLREHVPNVSEDQAGRYMRLARQIPHMRNLPISGSLRQAYIAARIIKVDSTEGESQQSTNKLSSPTKRFHIFERFLHKYAAKYEEGAISETTRLALIEEIDRTTVALSSFKTKLNHRSITPRRVLDAQK